MGQFVPTPKQSDTFTVASRTTSSSREDVRVGPRLTVVPPAQPSASCHVKRRWFSIVHPLQIHILIHMTVYSLIIFVLLMMLMAPLLMDALGNPTPVWPERTTTITSQLSSSWPWAFAVGLLVLIHSLHSIRLMHRVTGPLYRFQQVFQQISNGNLCTHTTLREDDYLHPESDLINQMTTQLETKIMALKHTQVLLALDVSRIKERAVAAADPALTVLTQQMEENLAGLKSSLDSFKTHG
jgi:hypothetical protein